MDTLPAITKHFFSASREYENGQYVKAVELAKTGIANNCVGSKLLLSYCYAGGEGVPRNTRISDQLRDSAVSNNVIPKLEALQNDAQALLWLGLTEDEDFGSSLIYFVKSSNLGNAYATCFVGEVVGSAHDHFVLATEQNAECCHAYQRLAMCYFHGHDVEKNEEKAIEICKKNAVKGYAASMYSLGNIYSARSNYEESIKYHSLAAEKHHPDALSCLAYFYEYGFGFKKDFERACDYYEMEVNALGECDDDYVGVRFKNAKQAATNYYLGIMKCRLPRIVAAKIIGFALEPFVLSVKDHTTVLSENQIVDAIINVDSSKQNL